MPAFLKVSRGHEAELQCRLGVKAQRWQTRQRWVHRVTWVAFVLVAMVMASTALRYEEHLQQLENGAGTGLSR